MGYVGNQQSEGFSQVPAKQDLTGATGTSLTLTHAVASAEGIDLYINNVRQEPTEAYSVVGTAVTLTGSVVATDDIYVVYNSLALQTTVPPDGSVTSAKLANNIAITGDLTVDTNTLYVDSTNNRVGVKTTSPSSELTLGSNSTIEMVGGSSKLLFKREDTTTSAGNPLGAIEFSHTDTDDAGTAAKIIGEGDGGTGQGRLAFHTGTPTALSERMRIDSSGRLLVNTNNTLANGASAKLQVYGASGHSAAFQSDNAGQQTLSVWNAGNSGTRYFVWFESSSGKSAVGSITSNGSSTSYNTTSDYRLKENVIADWDATTRLKQLNPVRFNFIADSSITVDGFLAHEVQTVVPEAISGTHNEVDGDGNPVYQGIDQSKLVPLLVKTIQELEARIAALEAS